MKRLLCTFAVLAAFVACNKTEPENTLDITGDWQISSIAVKSASLGSEKVDVYLRFNSDKSFELYQMLGAGRYRVYTGSWLLTEDVLSGSYKDGKKWGASYKVTLEGSKLTLTSQTSSPETDTYTRTTIPQTVIDTAE